MTRDEPSIAGLALSGMLWAAAVILTGLFVYSGLAPRNACRSDNPGGFTERDTLAVFDWPPPMLRCSTGFPLLDGKSASEREWTEYWTWPQLAFVAAVDALALADWARRWRAGRRRLDRRDRSGRAWPSEQRLRIELDPGGAGPDVPNDAPG